MFKLRTSHVRGFTKGFWEKDTTCTMYSCSLMYEMISDRHLLKHAHNFELNKEHLGQKIVTTCI